MHKVKERGENDEKTKNLEINEFQDNQIERKQFQISNPNPAKTKGRPRASVRTPSLLEKIIQSDKRSTSFISGYIYLIFKKI
jgi:hypothetical protein